MLVVNINTITTIPTYALISDSFKNWRGMQQSGGRRIKRAINIDINTIRFIKSPELEKLQQRQRLHDFFQQQDVFEFALDDLVRLAWLSEHAASALLIGAVGDLLPENACQSVESE